MCTSPFLVTVYERGQCVPVPCGRCAECLTVRIMGWQFRLEKELEASQSAHFITLTYRTDVKLELPRMTETGKLTLCKRDLQLFFKRLRKAHSGPKIKYYAVGEYGTIGWRPHYHVILFNSDPLAVESAWGLGDIHCGEVSEHSVAYTLKYVCKGKRVPAYPDDDRQPEFSLMSKRLGASYLTDEIRAWHHGDLLNRMYAPGKGGQKGPLPRYYKDKLYTSEERERIASLAKDAAEAEEKRLREKYGDRYDEQMAAVAAQKALKFKKLRRNEKL